jgi:transposase-like protein/Zn ribbon nucleic-acid-binding protein
MAQQENISLLTFQKKFNSNEKCRRYLFKHRFPDGYVCPKCGYKKYFEIKTRHQYQCKSCGYQTSVIANTIMRKTKTSLVKWFWAIYLCSTDKGGVSALRLQKQIRVTYKTAWLMLHKIREAMKSRDSDYQLAGLVEIDEAFFGGKDRDGSKGRGARKTKVLIQLSTNEDGNPEFARLKVMDDLKGKAVIKEINRNVSKGSVVITDGYTGYNMLSENNFKHEIANYIMKWIHVLISNAKTYIKGTYHGACKEHFQRYLDEFCYRFNRRFWEGQLFNRLLTACASCNPITYKNLISVTWV